MVEYTGREVLLKDENGEVIIPYVGIDAVLLTGDQNIGGLKTFTDGETTFKLGNGKAQNRIISSGEKYGILSRADETDFYLLLTDENDAMGSWNAIRPFRINLSTGVLSSEANAYVPDSNLANSVVVTRTISKGLNGYVKLGNGIIIQWGRTGSIGYDTQATISLPTAFTSTNYSIIPVNYNTTTGDEAINIRIMAKTTTNFNVKTYRIETKASGTRYIDWIAIGY